MKHKKELSLILVLSLILAIFARTPVSGMDNNMKLTESSTTGTMNITFDLHGHVLTYSSAGGDTITATCSGDIGECDLENRVAELKLEPPASLAYDGTAKEARITGEIPGIDTMPDITYKKNGTVISGSDVKEAGDYTASITLDDVKTGSDTTGSVTASVDFTITDDAHAVTVSHTGRGTVTPDKQSAKFGEDVKLTITPGSGYALKKISVKDAADKDVALDGDNDTFKMPASDVTVNVVFAPLATYTVFYKSADDVSDVYCELGNFGTSGKMTKVDADSNFWAVQIQGADDATSFPLRFSTDGGSNWTSITGNVRTDTSSLNSGGTAVVIKGETAAFMISFAEDDENEIRSYLVIPDMASVQVPAAPTAPEGCYFDHWEYVSSPSGDTKVTKEIGKNQTTVAVSGNITQPTIIYPVWKRQQITVKYDLNGGSWSRSNSDSVSYGDKLEAPADPVRKGFALGEWILKESVTERFGGQTRRISKYGVFDFSRTELIENATLLAMWRHAHSFVCQPLDSSDSNAKYNHVRICTGCGDKISEGHTFDSSGTCTACGYQKDESEKVTLTVQIPGEADKEMPRFKHDSVSVLAPADREGKAFVEWEYLSYSGKWRTLTNERIASFVITENMQIKAVYGDRPSEVEMSISSRMSDGGRLFQFNYALPYGWTLVDAGLISGDNSALKYKKVNSFLGGKTTYDDRDDNAIDGVGKDVLTAKMLSGQAVNVPGNSSADVSRATAVGQSGLAFSSYKGYSPETYFYGMGYVTCKDREGKEKTNIVGPIAVTYNEQVSIEEKDATIYNPGT